MCRAGGSPGKLALVAVRGPRKYLARSRAGDWAGILIPMLSVPAVIPSGNPWAALRTRVRGPGQNLSARGLKMGGILAATLLTVMVSPAMRGMGLPKFLSLRRIRRPTALTDQASAMIP